MRTQQQQRLFFCFDSKGKEREGQGRLKTLGNYVRHLRVAWQKKMNPPHFFVPLCCCYMLPMSVGCQLSQRSPSFFGLPTTNEGERDIGPSLSIRSLCHTHTTHTLLGDRLEVAPSMSRTITCILLPLSRQC